MQPSRRTRSLFTATMTTLGALALVGTTFTGTAAANGKGHEKRDERPAASQEQGPKADKADKGQGAKAADQASAAGHTEDNDTNDGGTPNNVADRGDDRHPSGKDRSVEHGTSGNQGKATSDPDDDGRGPDRSNGGPDKPNGSGGVDKADQDGNNGCGNDDDFEDDNEGWCGRKPAKAKAEQGKGKPATTPTTAKPGAPKHDHEPAKGAPAKGEDKPAKPAKGAPAKGDKPAKPATGNGTASITVVADCFGVSVTSSKDISHVVVHFVDGTSVKFEGLRGHDWSKTFTKQVAGATAKSATTRTSDTAGSCTTTAPADTCPAGMVDTNGSAAGGCVAPSASAGASCPVGMVDTNGDAADGCTIPGTGSVPCPVGMVDLNGVESGGCFTPEVLGAGATAACPTGGAAGTVMPAGCEVPMGAPATITPAGGEVLAAGATAAPASVRPTVSARSAGPAAVLGSVAAGALAFTGSNVVTLLVAALLALAAGWALIRADKRRSQRA